MEVCGKTVTYRLGRRRAKILKVRKNRNGEVIRKAFWMVEVRRLCDNVHQTLVMTTRQDLEVTEIALRMFSRWRQENFFRYMRREYGLDYLPTYDVEAANPERLVANPLVKEKRAQLAKLRKELSIENNVSRNESQTHLSSSMIAFKFSRCQDP